MYYAKPPFNYSPEEWRLLRSLKTPEKIQRFLDEQIRYNKEPEGPRCRSPRLVLRDRVAHCMEGAMLGAAALEAQGFPPLLVDLESVRDDDHVLAVYQMGDRWGSVAKSNYSGLRARSPVYRTLRELVMSYFEHYYNLAGEKTLRGYSRPIKLTRFRDWRTAERDVWEVPEYLIELRHASILPEETPRRWMDKRLFDAGFVGAVK
ncbi:MAG: hypothetical protein U0Q16_37805 [Bryobacteraceae bacterium]